MDVNALSLLVAGSLLLLFILLIGLCLSCRRPLIGPIYQDPDDSDYTQHFIVQRLGTQEHHRNDLLQTLSPIPAQSPSLVNRRLSTQLDDDESSQDYVNEDEKEDPEESGANNYIQVLPDPSANGSVSQSKQSLCPSQDSQGQEYVNLEDQKSTTPDQDVSDPESSAEGNYENLECPPSRLMPRPLSARSSVSDADTEDSESAEYVNMPQTKLD